MSVLEENYNPLVLIIVPAYNVEPYLKKCLDSIQNQTYKNLEVILIDDGSSDGTSNICDLYVNKDKRFKVIHKENQGLSLARNSGLDVMSGEYVTFVDSDDYIHPRLVEDCVQAVEENDADIVIFNIIDVKNGRENLREMNPHYLSGTNQIFEGIIRDTIPSYVWNKFYKAALWDRVRFMPNTAFEDLLVMPQIFRSVRESYFLNKGLYYYNNDNSGSISRNISPISKYGLFQSFYTRIALAKERKLEEGFSLYCRHRAIRSAVTGIGLHLANPLLTEEQFNIMQDYLHKEAAAPDRPPIGVKYRILFFATLHAPCLSKLYGKTMYSLQGLKKNFLH